MAARVRKRDCRTLRITYDRSLASRWPNLLLYDQSVVVSPAALPPRLEELVGSRLIVDLQCAEPLLGVAAALAEGSSVVTAAARERLQKRVEYGDKLTAMDRLHVRDVPVPTHLSGDAVTIGTAIAELGYPLMVKPRRGAAGADVIIVSDFADAERAFSGSLAPEDALFETFVAGEQLSYCAVFTEGSVLQEAAYERERDHAGSLGHVGSLRTLDEPSIFDVGQRVVAAVGGSGLVDLDIIRDRNGQNWVIDVNLRAWHSLGALLDAGVDFVDGYLFAIGVSTAPPRARRARPAVGLRLSLLLRREPESGRNLGPAVAWFLAASKRRIRAFGLRYWLSEMLTQASGIFCWGRR
jgi:hypothetical protein